LEETISLIHMSTRRELCLSPRKSVPHRSLPFQRRSHRPNHCPSNKNFTSICQSLTQQFETWRQRPLQVHWRILYLDGVHFSIRHGDRADATIILTALGVDLEGNKEVLALRACAEEGKEGWGNLLHDLRARGATQIDLIVTDGHEGVLPAVAQLFSATPRQRWRLA
jgi:putative transposase